MHSEIPSSNWAEFFLRFNDLNRNSLITIEHKTLDGQVREIARQMPMEGIRFEKDACNDRIRIGVGSNLGQREIDHEIIEPIHVRLKGEPGGRKFIQVEAENGVTLITFQNGRIPMEYEKWINKEVSSEEDRLAGIPGR